MAFLKATKFRKENDQLDNLTIALRPPKLIMYQWTLQSVGSVKRDRYPAKSHGLSAEHNQVENLPKSST